jgi:hypothetical protein
VHEVDVLLSPLLEILHKPIVVMSSRQVISSMSIVFYLWMKRELIHLILSISLKVMYSLSMLRIMLGLAE